MQLNIKIFIYLFIIISYTTFSFSQKKFDKEDYKIINLFLQEYQDTVYNIKNDKISGILKIYKDSIYLKKQCNLKFNGDYINSLQRKVNTYLINNKKCEAGEISVMDTIKNYVDKLKKPWFCIMRDNYKMFAGVVNTDDIKYLIAQDIEEFKSIDIKKIKNKKINIINIDKFIIKLKKSINNLPVKFDNAKSLRLEITGLNYNNKKNIAFLALNEIKIYSYTGIGISYNKYCFLYVKKDNNWQFVGNLDTGLYD